MQLSCLSRNVLYILGAFSSGTSWVMTNEDSIRLAPGESPEHVRVAQQASRGLSPEFPGQFGIEVGVVAEREELMLVEPTRAADGSYCGPGPI